MPGVENPTLQAEVAEAICAALFQTDFKPIGETEDQYGGGLVSWFTRGEYPKKIRVSVRRPKMADVVEVQVEWHNVAVGGAPLKGQQTLSVSTLAATRAMVKEPVEQLVVGVLNIFHDVLLGEGVAGVIAELAPEAPEGLESDT